MCRFCYRCLPTHFCPKSSSAFVPARLDVKNGSLLFSTHCSLLTGPRSHVQAMRWAHLLDGAVPSQPPPPPPPPPRALAVVLLWTPWAEPGRRLYSNPHPCHLAILPMPASSTLLGLKPNSNQTAASTSMTRPQRFSALCPCSHVQVMRWAHLLDGAVSS